MKFKIIIFIIIIIIFLVTQILCLYLHFISFYLTNYWTDFFLIQRITFGHVKPSVLYVFADILHQKMTETCASAHIGGVNIVLLEGITPDIQYVQIPFNFPIPN